MKKKFGFTLAEVLITLTVIGVVSALAAPALVGNFQKSKVGPSLRKFINIMETANQHILVDKECESLSSVTSDTEKYAELLTKYVKGNVAKDSSGNALTMDKLTTKIVTYTGEDYHSGSGNDGRYYIYNLNSGDSAAIDVFSQEDLASIYNPPTGSYKGMYALVLYDINGFDNKPNKLAKDIFSFAIDGNGSVIPQGGSAFGNAYPENDPSGTEPAWKYFQACTETKVKDGLDCAGSVADNGWKVIYKY